ncbi:ribosomal L7Ae/L30e/S12e/Gadd45 family protein [Eubacteriales bacterium OttesenSCG-928-K08]|nr:ribosomal L7Ae/L30e/S12e/Gadd45 family protein [Eubacteriales bacterium OttesenSCG-928-K08]
MASIQGALGLCKRAGKCLTGDFACERALKSGNAKLIVLDDQASNATRERYEFMCKTRDIPFLIVPEAGNAVGKSGCRIIAILDEGFAKMIKNAQ